ncbi:hypothetical protein [Rhizobium sp. 21-4511-3d]
MLGDVVTDADEEGAEARLLRVEPENYLSLGRRIGNEDVADPSILLERAL